jgi:hypothetical protein
MARLTEEQIAQLLDQGRKLQQLEDKLDKKFVAMEQQLTSLQSNFTSVQQEVAGLKRSVVALESFPVPNGRPKQYLSAADTQSVTGSTRVRYGHQG